MLRFVGPSSASKFCCCRTATANPSSSASWWWHHGWKATTSHVVYISGTAVSIFMYFYKNLNIIIVLYIMRHFGVRDYTGGSSAACSEQAVSRKEVVY
jgi:hypothetical protein